MWKLVGEWIAAILKGKASGERMRADFEAVNKTALAMLNELKEKSDKQEKRLDDIEEKERSCREDNLKLKEAQIDLMNRIAKLERGSD